MATTGKTLVHAVRWVEDKETFYLVARTLEIAEEGYKENTKFDHTSRRDIERISCSLEEISKNTGVALKDILVRFTGKGSRNEFALFSPRGML